MNVLQGARKTSFTACHSGQLNMVYSHVKRSLLLWLHNESCLSQQKNIYGKWFGISLVFIEHYMATWRYEISLLVLKNIST